MNDSTGYERRDLNVRAVAWFMAGLALILTGIFVGLHYFQSFLNDGRPQAAAPISNTAPAPRLQSNPRMDLKAWRSAQEAELNRYRWVDRQAGIVEIPIEQAMELTLQRGLPARQPNASQGGPP
ncbi:MAG: hypothetical protein J0L73_20505 [Verrucomicrobia bacterium]|nr:hypothetical protein [Verrucomicrobiota bacterium]